MEQDFGKGALKGLKDIRDYKAKNVLMAYPPFDWTLGFDIEQARGITLVSKNQGHSGSCGGQASSYYGAVLRKILHNTYQELSAKFVYSQAYAVGGGSTIDELTRVLVTAGDCEEILLSSYEDNQPPSEEFMQNTSWKTSPEAPQIVSNGLLGQEMGYAKVDLNLDAIAQAIRDHGGVILGIEGQNNGTWLSPYPKPPIGELDTWGHFLYAGRAKLIDGKKYIGVKNSWGNVAGENGWQYLGEEYVPFIFIARSFFKSSEIIYPRGEGLKKLLKAVQNVLAFLLPWVYKKP